MNTNNNLYTVIYTTLIVVVVAAVLAFVSQSLKGRQEANEKADTISQMMTAAQFGTKADFQKMGNAAVLEKYAAEIEEAYTVNAEGERVADLPLDKVYSPSELKRQNYNIKGGQNASGTAELPVFVFKDGTTVVPVYGAGLWGPVWGYIAFEKDSNVIKGAYFDHESETAGLGARIKDDPAFQAEFQGERAAFRREPGLRHRQGRLPEERRRHRGRRQPDRRHHGRHDDLPGPGTGDQHLVLGLCPLLPGRRARGGLLRKRLLRQHLCQGTLRHGLRRSAVRQHLRQARLRQHVCPALRQTLWTPLQPSNRCGGISHEC